MVDVSWLLFTVASLLLIVTPGQDILGVLLRTSEWLFLALKSVRPGAVHPTVSVFVLGLVFAGLTFVVKGPVGFAAGILSAWLRSRPKVLLWLFRTSGMVLIGLGVKLAFERRA